MSVESLVSLIRNTSEVKLLSSNFYMGIENSIRFEILDKNDFSKWEYFRYKMTEKVPSVRTTLRGDTVTAVFPLMAGPLCCALDDFEKAFRKRYYEITRPPKKHLSIIAKITNLCNLDCVYCYDRPFRDCLGHNGIIPVEKLDRLIAMASRHAEEVCFLFHGGEATLAGLDYFKVMLLEVFPKYPYTEFSVSVQTNGTLINKEWFEFVQSYNKTHDSRFSFGSSYNAMAEGLRHTLSTNEIGSKEHSIDSVLANIHLAKEYNIHIGVIDVLTKLTHPHVKEIYEFYKEEGVHNCFNLVTKAGAAVTTSNVLFETAEDIKNYEKVTAEYFEYWSKDKSKNVFDDRYAGLYIQLLLTGIGEVCSHGGNCVFNWIGINSNGDLYPCDRPLAEKYRIGNIDTINSIEEAFQSGAYQDYAGERSYKKVHYCRQCPYYPYCHGGCVMEDIDVGSAAHPNRHSCRLTQASLRSAYKALFQVSIDTCNSILRRYILLNGCVLPGEIPALLEYLGLEEQFPGADFSPENAVMFNREFKLFTYFNHPDASARILPFTADMSQMCEPEHDGKGYEDDRFERIKSALLKQAEENSRRAK